MPECVSVSEFVQEVQDDWSSPTTSFFTSKMLNCRNTVYLLEEVSGWYQNQHRWLPSPEVLQLPPDTNRLVVFTPHSGPNRTPPQGLTSARSAPLF